MLHYMVFSHRILWVLHYVVSSYRFPGMLPCIVSSYRIHGVLLYIVSPYLRFYGMLHIEVEGGACPQLRVTRAPLPVDLNRLKTDRSSVFQNPAAPPPHFPRTKPHGTFSKVLTCSPPLPTPLPSLPCRRLLPTATMVRVKDEKENLDFGAYASDEGENNQPPDRENKSPSARVASATAPPHLLENRSRPSNFLSRATPGPGRHHDSCETPDKNTTCGKRADCLGAAGVAGITQRATRRA